MKASVEYSDEGMYINLHDVNGHKRVSVRSVEADEQVSLDYNQNGDLVGVEIAFSNKKETTDTN